MQIHSTSWEQRKTSSKRHAKSHVRIHVSSSRRYIIGDTRTTTIYFFLLQTLLPPFLQPPRPWPLRSLSQLVPSGRRLLYKQPPPLSNRQLIRQTCQYDKCLWLAFEAGQAAKVAAIVAVCSTIPGYWFTVYFIDRVGRVKIQIMGFFLMAVVYLVAGIPYSWYRSDHGYTSNKGFVVLYGLIFFFSNFGPNTTTFIIPAELFPARFRSTCHGISGAAGKLGAIVGTVGFLWGTKRDEEHKDVFPDVKRVRIAFLILGGVCIAGVLVTYFCTRETMGRSLEENEEDEIITRMSSADELLPRRQWLWYHNTINRLLIISSLIFLRFLYWFDTHILM